MTPPGYPAARLVAARAHSYFERHFALERDRVHESLAPQPDIEAIETLIDAAFWASLRHEEGYTPKISLAFLPPEQAGLPITFERHLPLNPETLTRLAPAVERPGIHLGVWRDAEHFYIWGATRRLPALCFVVEVIDPGLLVIKRRRRQESAKFVNVAVLEGDQIKVLDPQAANFSDAPPLVASLLGFDLPSPDSGSISSNTVSANSLFPRSVTLKPRTPTPGETNAGDVLIQLALSMRAHGRGGSLLVIPHEAVHQNLHDIPHNGTPQGTEAGRDQTLGEQASGEQAWRESMVGLTPYSVSPPYSELADLISEDPGERSERRWQETLRRAIDVVAGLTAVDGATVLTDQCELLAFGAKIGRREGWPRIEHVIDTEPIEGSVARVVHPSQLGGTRHLSAAQFAQDQNNSIALVASQDGRFTIFAWSPREKTVHAYRVEALLL